MDKYEEWLEERQPKFAERCCICKEIARDKIYDIKSSEVDFYNKVCSACKTDFYVEWKVKKHGR